MQTADQPHACRLYLGLKNFGTCIFAPEKNAPKGQVEQSTAFLPIGSAEVTSSKLFLLLKTTHICLAA